MSDSLKDRRTRFTRNEIRKTYLELLEKDPQGKITVSSLCRAANIGRGTFYLHYQDILAVEEDIEDLLYQESAKAMADVFSGAMIGNEKTNYRHLLESPAWQKFYFERPGGRLSQQMFQNSLDRILEKLAHVDLPEKQKIIYAVYTVGGAIAVEHYRHAHVWEDFEEENAYYTQILNAVDIAVLKNILVRK